MGSSCRLSKLSIILLRINVFSNKFSSCLCVDATEEVVLLVRKLEQLSLGVPSTAVLGAVGREQQEAISLIPWVEHEDETRYVLKKQTAALSLAATP